MGRSVDFAPVSAISSDSDWGIARQALGLVTHPHALGLKEAPTKLVEKHQHVANRVEKHKLDIRWIGVGPTFQDIMIYPATQSDWVVMPVEKDPEMQLHGVVTMPKRVIRELKIIRKAGLNFERLYIAHEKPKGLLTSGRPVALEALLPPTPRRIAKVNARSVQVTRSAWDLTVFAARAALAVAGVAAAIPAGIAALAAAPTISRLDPIIFGLYVDERTQVNGQPLATWYFLTSWYEGEE